MKEAQSGKILYAPGSYNARGQMNHYGIANQSIYTHMEYDIYGLPTFIKTGHSYPGSTNIQYLETQFDVQTGNLNYRKDHNYSVNEQILSETFAYDPVHKNRLASWQVTGQQAYTMTYATNNGNVLTKSDVTSAGNPYQYTGTQPHAVTSIHAPLLLPAENLQTITYNHFNSVKQILHSAEGKRLALQYGTDGQRVKTQYYTQNVTLAETKYFVGGDYEVEITHATGAQRRIHYLPGGGMYVLDQNNNSTLYYILTDYQGNHYKVINEQGNTIEHYSFDAWGKRRNATNWSYDNVPATFLFDRGYTGHEHLDEFGLINMNGRVYDPVIARFLSPDNYVQAPGSSQGFNRYSYCFNNPLVYTDPSGENPAIIFAMIAYQAIVGGLNSAQNGDGFFQGFALGTTTGIVSAGVGAAIGPIIPGGGIIPGMVNSAVPAAIGSGITYGINAAATNQPFDWKGWGVNVGMAAIWGGVEGGISVYKANKSADKFNQRRLIDNKLTLQSKLNRLIDASKTYGLLPDLPDNAIKDVYALSDTKYAKRFPNSYAVRTGGKSYDFVNPDTKIYGSRIFRRVKLEGQSLYFPKSTINAMWEGSLPLEIIAHEFNHAKQYFYGTYFDEFDFWALDLDPRYLDAWIELKALNQNIQRSSWDVFIANQAKEQLIYQELFFKYNEIIAQ